MSKEQQFQSSFLPADNMSEDLPPPYEELSRPPSSVLTDITTTTITGPSGPRPGRPFPVAFNLYYAKGNPVSKISTFILGEHFDQPCNAVILSDGLDIHETADAQSPVLAHVHFEKGWSGGKTITLPGHLSPDGLPISDNIRAHIGFKHVDFDFTVPVENADSKPRPEKFEWRMSHGKEVEDLHLKTWGFKLVRVGGEEQPTASGSSSSGSGDANGFGLTSDGKEVVAVWAANSQFSKNKLGRFQFLGSGARGELGEPWAIMAVASMLCMAQGVNKKLMFGSS